MFSVAGALTLDGVPRVVLARSSLGTIFMELYEDTGTTVLAGRSYQIVASGGGGPTFSGTVGDDGRLRHEDVPPDDYVLSVDGYEEKQAALVFDKNATDPQIRFLDSAS